MSLHLSDPGGGIACVASALGKAELNSCKAGVDAFYRILGLSGGFGSPAELSRIIPPGEKAAPTASSVTVLCAFSLSDLQRFAAALCPEFHERVRSSLNAQPVCDLDEAWIRRQYAPSRYPRAHAPHGWHQDGALAYDFTAPGLAAGMPEAVLPMMTGWITLDSCGMDAPGLELVTRRLNRLLKPAELVDGSVRASFPVREFWQPSLAPGDALLFSGDILHRTHVSSTMTTDRTSIELRFFPADGIPERLKSHRFVSLW
jgi:hypothetical protein